MTTVSSDPRMAARLEELAGGLERPALVTCALPESFAARLAAEGLVSLRHRSLVSWESPERDLALFGFGVAAECAGGRESPLADAAVAIREAGEGARQGAIEPAARPRWFGGGRFLAGGSAHDIAWDPFGGWRFIVPSVLLALSGGAAAASLTVRSLPGHRLLQPARQAMEQTFSGAAPLPVALPSVDGFREWGRSDWENSVRFALREMETETLEKVVLARSLRVHAEVDEGRLLTNLAERYGQCFVFSFKARGGTWLGASPELLCRVDDGTVEAESLAGSRPRGSCEESDRLLAEELFSSAKERTEHALVARAIEETLSELCSEVSVPARPELMRMANIQHLSTPISGRLHSGLGVLDVVSRLHPTPAVAGWPRPQAIDAIERLEMMDRGWYAGPIGWVDLEGDGEFAVALRSALVGRNEARLYAGGGIVPGSVPDQEYQETETKFRPIREALVTN